MFVNKRVLKDIDNAKKNLVHEFGIYIAPEEANYYAVHYLLSGPPDTPFEGGLYHGMVRLNDDHPKYAPRIYMFTPNGRFTISGYPIPKNDGGICTTATAYHPDEWTPMWDIETVLKGLVSLMCEPYDGKSTGGMKSTDINMKNLAKKSLNHLKQDQQVNILFPDILQDIMTGTYKQIDWNKKTSNDKNTASKKDRKKISKKHVPITISSSDDSSDNESSDYSDDDKPIITKKKKSVKTKKTQNKRPKK